MTTVEHDAADTGAPGALEGTTHRGIVRFPLAGRRVTIGKVGVDVCLDDPTVSRLHAAVEPVTGGWIVQDLGSRNGTYVNGERVLGPRGLRSGDELRIGRTVLSFRAGEPAGGETAPLSAPPRFTGRERDALVALCRPLLAGSMLAEPATTATIAAELVVTESAVKKLLARASDKLDLLQGDRRRARLAAEALRLGVVTPADLDRGSRD